MYNTQILNKYNFVFTNYDTNEAITKQSVPNEYRLINTIVSYLDFKGFLHIELFVGTEEDLTDDKWIDNGNWIDTKLIYHKCFNKEYDTDFSTTANAVFCPLRYRGNILHIQNYPMLDSCGEVYYEDKTYRYTCFCCDDCKYGNIDNWEEYDFQLVIDDIVKIVTDLMEQANDIDYGILTPDEEMIKDLIEQIFNEWLNDEKLTQIVNAWLEGQNITSIVESWLEEQNFQDYIKQLVADFLEDYDFTDEIVEQVQIAIDNYFKEHDLTQEIINAVNNYLGDNIEEILNNYFEGDEGNQNLTEIINNLLDDKIGDYLDAIVTYIRDNERVIANALVRHEQAITELQNA